MSSKTVPESSISSQPALLLLHGATLNGHMWDAVRRQLEPRWRVVTPDLPGHGTRRAEAFTLAGAVAAVQAAAEALGDVPFVLGGDSLGGYVTLAAAAAMPQERLVGVVPSGCSANLSGRALWPFHLRSLLQKLLIAVLGEKRILGPSMVKKLGELGMAEHDARALLEAGVSMKAFPQAVAALANVDFRAKLAAIPQPVLLVNGSKDPDMMRQHAAFEAVMRDGRAHVFEGVEHGVTVRRSAEFAALLEGFAISATRRSSRD